MWVRQWLSEQRREKYGHYSTLLNELRTEDETSFYNYTRLHRALFDELLHRIEGRINKKDTWYRNSLRLKLSITLRHLACGDSYRSLSYNFRVAPNTISLIIHEVCDHQNRVCCWGDSAIWKEMAISTLLWCVGWQACGSYMSLEHWLHVQKLQKFLLYCSDILSRCRLQVFEDWCRIWWFQQRRQNL